MTSGWREWVGLGREANQLLSLAYGPETLRDLVSGLLLSDPITAQIGDTIANGQLAGTPINGDELLEGIVGGLLVRMAQILPDDLEPKRVQEALEKGPLPHLQLLQGQVQQALKLGVGHQSERVQQGLKILRSLKVG
jgi:hypothetical protein